MIWEGLGKMKKELSFAAELPYIENEFEDAVWDTDTGLSAGDMEQALTTFLDEHRNLPMPTLRAEAFAFLLEHVQIALNPHTPFSAKLNLGIDYHSFAGQDLFARCLFYPFRSRVLEEKAPDVWKAVNTAAHIGAGEAYFDYWHTVPDWERLLRLGFPGLLSEAKDARERAVLTGAASEDNLIYRDAMILSLSAILSFLGRLAKISVRYDVPDFTDAVRALAVREPQTLYEVMVFSVLYLYMEEIGVERGRSLGPVDRLYAPYYRADLAAGRLTEAEADDLFRFYFLHFSAAKRFAAQPVTMGGADENGVPFANELTDKILDLYRAMDIVNPKIHFRYAPSLPPHLLPKLLSMIREGKSAVCILNDDVILAGYERLGIPRADASRYVLLGCYEPVIMGKEEAEIADCWMNLVKAVEFVFTGGVDRLTGISYGLKTPDDYPDFESFFSACLAQIDCIVDSAMEQITVQRRYLCEVCPSLVYSASFCQCTEKGEDAHALSAPMDWNNSSIKCYGFATLVDAVYAVKKYVFDRKELTFAELRQVLADNWDGHELLRARILCDREKYGCGVPGPDAVFGRIFAHLTDRIVGKPNDRGGVWRFGMDSITHNLDMGYRTAATPDGRRDREQLSKNLCAVNGMDREGVTGLMATLLSVDHTKAIDSAILDFIVHPSAVEGEKGLDAFVSLVRSYFAAGGFAVQGNMISGTVLRDAQEHPERYPNLQIRVCGWNEYFTAMEKGKQDMFIRQTEGQG